jgi:uncharacterized cofD-like protein
VNVKIVAIGGGTGLSVLLRGLKHHTDQITAIVTVADDGGSSGTLRHDLGVPPPGDFRNCIAALANDEALITQLFQYRFRKGQGLKGHSFGNLFITALVDITGSFEQALSESGRVLNIRGTILPSTLKDVTLFAELNEGRKVKGESAIPEAKLPIARVYLQPDAPPAFPPAIQAILQADLIIIGPGSLYTSIIPNLLVPDIPRAIRVSRAAKIFVCSVATQAGETDGYTLHDFVEAIETHADTGEQEGPLLSHVLANNNLGQGQDSISPLNSQDGAYEVITADVVDTRYPWRHDPIKLANHLMAWYQQITL